MGGVLFATSDAALYAIPLASTVIALAALVLTALLQRGAADQKRVDRLERDLHNAEQRLSVCETHRAQLQSQVDQMGGREVQLLRLIATLEERVTEGGA